MLPPHATLPLGLTLLEGQHVASRRIPSQNRVNFKAGSLFSNHIVRGWGGDGGNRILGGGAGPSARIDVDGCRELTLPSVTCPPFSITSP